MLYRLSYRGIRVTYSTNECAGILQTKNRQTLRSVADDQSELYRGFICPLRSPIRRSSLRAAVADAVTVKLTPGKSFSRSMLVGRAHERLEFERWTVRRRYEPRDDFSKVGARTAGRGKLVRMRFFEMHALIVRRRAYVAGQVKYG